MPAWGRRSTCRKSGGYGLPASSTLQLERAWDAWQVERYQRGEIDQRPGYADNRSGRANDHPRAHRTASPELFRKLDAIAVLTGPSLPAPQDPALFPRPLPLSG